MSTINKKDNGGSENKMAIDADEMEEDEDPIDDEQLEEYTDMVQQLGTFPDKVKINSLSMVAEDHMDSRNNAAKIYEVIRQKLVSKTVSGDRKLPLVYVIDSILKNVKGEFVPIIEKDAKQWLPVVHKALSEEKRAKLKKVYNLWKDAAVFSESNWAEMGICFSGTATDSLGPVTNSSLEKAGITSGKDGGLLLMPKLRLAMQSILDDLQSDVQDELEKVSLERLSSINPDLLVKIKQTAEDSLRNGGGGGGGNSGTKNTPQKENDTISFLVETRTPHGMERSKGWAKLKLDHLKVTHDLVHALQHLVLDASKEDSRYMQIEALDMTGALAVAATTAGMLTSCLQQIQNEEKKSKSSSAISGVGAGAGAPGSQARGFFSVDKNLFTNEGIKKKNDAVVGILYEVGLPFISSADGRRFATQLELSNHLDSLFKRGQLEKTMARTEERGWYVSDSVWSGESKATEQGTIAGETPETAGPATAEEEADPSTFTMPADESRDRCVICGINFKMFFDNEDGIYKYNNCREIEVLNDEAAAKESEEMLVHVTCWRALGSPQVLTMDQALQEVIHC